MRGIAALGVVAFHIGATSGITRLAIFQGGNQFVDFFFVLSGFVIALVYGAKLEAGMPLGQFMALRLGRVWPLHAVMVLAFLGVEFSVLYSQGAEAAFQGLHSPWHFIRSLLLLDGWFVERRNYYSGVSWSVSVELLLYVLAALAFRSGKRAQIALVALAPLALWLDWNGLQWPVLTDSIQRGIGGFGLGIGVSWLHRRWQALPLSPTLLELAVLALLVIDMLSYGVVPIAVPSALVILVLAGRPGLIGRLLVTSPMAWMGRISYSICMVHPFVITAELHLLAMAEQHFGWSLLQRVDVAGARHPVYFLALDWLPASLVQLAMIATVLAAAHLTWTWIEGPARQWWGRKFGELRPSNGPAAGLSTGA